ncbi:MAG: hypothetical protein QOI63_1303 [Thermoplasmata archaeon]|jgi:hypothetical protein|nr:hypothetical protein [Thermoplasmata archaeon]
MTSGPPKPASISPPDRWPDPRKRKGTPGAAPPFPKRAAKKAAKRSSKKP